MVNHQSKKYPKKIPTNALGIKLPTLTKLEQPTITPSQTFLVLVNTTIKGIDFFNFLHIQTCYLFAYHTLKHENKTIFDTFTIRECKDKYSKSTFFCFNNHNSSNQTLIGYDNCLLKINRKATTKKHKGNILPNQLSLNFDTDFEEQIIDNDYEEVQWNNFLQKMQSKSTLLQEFDFVFHFSYNNYICLKPFFLFFLTEKNLKYQLLPIEHLEKNAISEFYSNFAYLEDNVQNYKNPNLKVLEKIKTQIEQSQKNKNIL